MAGEYRFSFGPWNIHTGADPFGPEVREAFTWEEKLPMYKAMGFDGVQFHDDDAVPDMNDLSAAQIKAKAKAIKKQLDDAGLVAEVVAPRLWEDPRTIDGGYTANDPALRKYAIERSKIAVDIANELGTDLMVLWLAREGTYIREAKDSHDAVLKIADAMNVMLEHDPKIRIAVEPKPNEPMDHTYIPTIGHAIAIGGLTVDAKRVGGLIESAHAILAGLDPSDEMGYALAHGKLWSVHLNDQNGLTFDQDTSFGSVDLRRAFNQVRILDKHEYGKKGEYVGLDVKAMRSQKKDVSTKHLSNSRTIFLKLLEIVRSLDDKKVAELISQRDYEELDLLIMSHLLG